jgi:HSP20 family molecular chaperone IbpA
MITTKLMKNKSYEYLLDQFWKYSPLPELASNNKDWNYVFDTETDKWKIVLDLPGYDKSEINITYGHEYIYIHADNKSRGKQQRGFVIYNEMELSSATSEYKNGVLTIDIPKIKENESKNNKKIPIL